MRDVYFLDPQWLAKLMAKVIKPVENESLVKNGVCVCVCVCVCACLHVCICMCLQTCKFGQMCVSIRPFSTLGVANIDTLFSEYKGQKHLQDKYISLLEKFDVVQKLGDNQVIIPTLMPDSAQYPDTMDVFSDFEMSLRSFQPPLRRIWCSNFIPNGFWPRLVCRIATDEQIGKVSNYTCSRLVNITLRVYLFVCLFVCLFLFRCWTHSSMEVFTMRTKTTAGYDGRVD